MFVLIHVCLNNPSFVKIIMYDYLYIFALRTFKEIRIIYKVSNVSQLFGIKANKNCVF